MLDFQVDDLNRNKELNNVTHRNLYLLQEAPRELGKKSSSKQQQTCCKKRTQQQSPSQFDAGKGCSCRGNLIRGQEPVVAYYYL